MDTLGRCPARGSWACGNGEEDVRPLVDRDLLAEDVGRAATAAPTVHSRWDSAGKRTRLSVRPSRAPAPGPGLSLALGREARPQLGCCAAHENVSAVHWKEEGMAGGPSLSCHRARGLGWAQEQRRVPHLSEALEPIHSPRRTVLLCAGSHSTGDPTHDKVMQRD